MKPYYYALRLMPEDNEVQHSTLAGAQSEAERKATKSPGSSYEIVKCVGIASCSKASTFWMDGEEPAADLREFEFYRNADKSIFWRVGKDTVEVAFDYGNDRIFPWERSLCPKRRVEGNEIRITADELPESLA
jgi:hypothetical protein